VSESSGGKLVLIDGNSLLYRAFFALPPLTNAKGEMTNAAYGFTTMLLKIIEEEQPDMVGVAWDLPTPTFRHERFPEYKATRDQMPDELASQIGMARDILEAMGIPAYEMEGYEADDVIGTLASKAESGGDGVLVVTGDLDELQLASDRVSVMVTRRGITETKVYDAEAVRERYGFGPERLADFRGLKGDTSDNIPGVPGIGEKTAASLIKQFGSLEAVLDHSDEVRPPRIAAALEAHAELAKRAKDLSIIIRDLSIPYDREALRLGAPDEAKLAELFGELGFRSLLARLGGKGEAVRSEHRVITKVGAVRSLASQLAKVGEMVLYPLAEEGTAMTTPMSGLCLLVEDEAVVVMDGEKKVAGLLKPLKAVLESPGVGKVGHDLKRLALLLSRHGVALRGLRFDTMLASYLIDPSRRTHDLSSAAYQHLEFGEKAALPAGEPLDAGTAAVAARQIAGLRDFLTPELEERGLKPLFHDVEMPLIPLLAQMEEVGIAIDAVALKALSEPLAGRARQLEQDICALAGEEFTIGSPKQLQRILFDKLGLPPDKGKRTKSGYSTDADVLAGLSDYEIVAKILEYREVTKLKSTYVDALPRLVDPETGRVHSSLNQAGTATGRLSSSDPNLQNIPVRTQLGMEIRRAFVAGRPDEVLLSADYSQIELRILAHITGDENLVGILQRDEDLHRATASEIFGVDPEEVEPRMRSFAKMVNYGIPYGISEFRLAREMGISVGEAREYVDRYFTRFPRVYAYVKEMPERARKSGYVVTLMGRRRPLPELRTRALVRRQAAERMAINTPIQGTAADIMKVAMLRVQEGLDEKGLKAKMILQVHDELLLEVPREELKETGAVVTERMASAYDLCVPLRVDAKAGPNWMDMKSVD
jgi:DNA polymerase-1